MKNYILSVVFLLTATSLFAQQLPIRIVNNTAQTVTINVLEFYGATPLNPPSCSGCGNTYSTDSFNIGASQVWYTETYADLIANVDIFGDNCGPCLLVQVQGNCDTTFPPTDGYPIWSLLSFSHPNLDGRIGDPSCGFPDSDAGGGVTASWAIVNNEVLVIFN